MELTLESERPAKRLKLDFEENSTPSPPNSILSNDDQQTPSPVHQRPEEADVDKSNAAMEAQALKESAVGIKGYICPQSEYFTGILKKRYTDFLVNEIQPNGEVCHLTSLKPPKIDAKEQKIASKVGKDVKMSSTESRATSATDEKKKPVNGHSAESRDAGEVNGQSQTTEALKDDSRLESFSTPNPNVTSANHETGKEGEIAPDDKALLISYLDDSTVSQLLALYEKILANPNTKPKEHGSICYSAFTSDRTVRGQIHQAIRRIFSSRIDSTTDVEGVLFLSAALPSHRQPRNQPGRGSSSHVNQSLNGRSNNNKPSWADRGGQHLHFSLFKENKDTMEVLSYLARQLKTNMKTFQFAGTKDRRAVTVQRISAFRIEAERMTNVNRSLRGAQLGNFSYEPHGLELGDLHGNEFIITLRECSFPSIEKNTHDQPVSMESKLTLAKNLVTESMRSLRQNGFTNYFGLQRFGTFQARTDTVGVALLQGNFAEACNLILSFDTAALSPETANPPIGRDDAARALAIHQFTTKKANITSILSTLPRKFNAEAALIRHLTAHPGDHYGALQLIPRNLRTMYAHAYQSLVWNHAATHRRSIYGSRVVAGDLVLVSEHQDKEIESIQQAAEGSVQGLTDPKTATTAASIDADGEIIVEPSAHDRSNTVETMFERARILTESEVATGLYSIFDIVLPLPGFDIIYPSHQTGQFYRDFMASAAGGGLDPLDMRRKQKDFSLSGSYRKVMARIGTGKTDGEEGEEEDMVQVKAYAEDSEQFVETDLERTRRSGGMKDVNGYQGLERKNDDVVEGTQESKEADKIAVVLKFQLGSSQYATMALRELTKGGVQAHKPDFGGRG